MDTQRTILWVVFSVSLLMLWNSWQRHNGKPTLFESPVAQQAAPATSTSTGDSAPPVASPSAAPGTVSTPQDTGLNTGTIVTVSTDVLRLEIDTLGGKLIKAALLKHADGEDATQPVVLLDHSASRTYFARTGLAGPAGSQYPNHLTPFEIVEGARELSSDAKELVIEMKATAGGLDLIRRYRLARGSYSIKVEQEVSNHSGSTVSPQVYFELARDGNKPPGESQFYSTFTGPSIYTDAARFQKIEFSDIEKGKAEHAKSADDGWIAMIQHYFVSAWIAEQGGKRDYYTRKLSNNLYAVGSLQSLGEIAEGGQAKNVATLYLGPQDQRVLETLAPGLDLVVDYGWLTLFAKPLYWLLEKLYGLVNNWGWAIVLLTVLVKALFFPLTAASYKSMAKMKKVAPRLQALKERYGDDKMKLQQAMMEMYKTEKINPLGGCLPVLIQMPVFIALYWVLLASVEMRGAPWLGWIQDLSAPDPYYLLPGIMAASMFLQVKLNPPAPDPMQQKVMMMMPIFFSVMFFFFPAGLVLYWVVNNLISIAQQWHMNRTIEQSTARSGA